MSGYCPITGETQCKCDQPRELMSPLQVDMHATMRKLFTDHGVYTKFVINSIVDASSDTDVMLKRLLANQVDIGNQVKPIIGERKGTQLSQLLTEHIKLAGEVIKSAVRKDRSAVLKQHMSNLFDNSDQVGAFLSSLNPDKLPLAQMQDMFAQHNQQVIDMTTHRIKKQHAQEQKLYDAYYNHLLQMSDGIVDAL